MRIVSEDFAYFENSRGRSAISLLLSKAWLTLASKPRAPGEAIFAKQHWKRSGHRTPISAAGSLK
jgi:hypothetical protein